MPPFPKTTPHKMNVPFSGMDGAIVRVFGAQTSNLFQFRTVEHLPGKFGARIDEVQGISAASRLGVFTPRSYDLAQSEIQTIRKTDNAAVPFEMTLNPRRSA